MPTTIHIGHHFFGAGNAGDDFMLAGFLSALAGRGRKPGRGSSGFRHNVALTCCVPYPMPPLARRFPEIAWRPYDEVSRRAGVDACDAWLGLGGSPFQNAVSPWFAEHLATEAALCRAAGKPMYFLGVGGQDEAAYEAEGLRTAAAQAEAIWTRDPATARALAAIARPGKIRTAADLSHIFFEICPPPAAVSGRLTAVLNFDYAGWPDLEKALAALAALPAVERVWLAQEDRPLPGAERALFGGLPAGERARWRLQMSDMPGEPLRRVLARWPSGEWLLASRFHATVAAAWAGSRAVVVATNDKLRGVAAECGYPAFEIDDDPSTLAHVLEASAAPERAALQSRAEAARQACAEFFAAIGL